jgi:hypothetical protein
MPHLSSADFESCEPRHIRRSSAAAARMVAAVFAAIAAVHRCHVPRPIATAPRRNVSKINAYDRILAGPYQVCQSSNMAKRRSHRWSLVLGMVAMLGSLVTLPMTTSIAVAMAGPTTAATADQMPCHKPAKPCPDCPQKVCPNMGSCLVKCFQPLSSPVAEVFSQGLVVNSRVLAAPSQVVSGSLTPPLLRPPSV